ncbi:MAG: histidine phosphatase family protein [Verrucomicrobiota bacterium]|nr:histidine phosphatase family protein [Verrucomicrobiota bacterium]
MHSAQTENWPSQLWIVRHGESAGNVARREALARGGHEIEIGMRDMDVPLSSLGERQAEAVGYWFRHNTDPPDAILTSPYVRARHTAELLAAAAGWNAPMVQDERLREKEFGIIDALTSAGIVSRHPEQATFRKSLGKFYHRAPGGESWCDVILRLRSVSDSLRLEYSNQRVLVVCHTVVVLCFRYLLEKLTEEQILAIDREHNVANCSITSYRREDMRAGVWTPERFNFVAPIREAGEPITDESDSAVASR